MSVRVIMHKIGYTGFGGVTLIAEHHPGDSFYNLTTAICSKEDQYCKRIGVANAVAADEKGQTIRLPLMLSSRNNVRHRDLRDELELLAVNIC